MGNYSPLLISIRMARYSCYPQSHYYSSKLFQSAHRLILRGFILITLHMVAIAIYLERNGWPRLQLAEMKACTKKILFKTIFFFFWYKLIRCKIIWIALAVPMHSWSWKKFLCMFILLFVQSVKTKDKKALKTIKHICSNISEKKTKN